MRARGFTLLEMMTVVGIVGVLSALATFAFQQVSVQGRVSGEIRRVMARVQQARALSVATSQCHGILIGGPSSTLLGGSVRNRLLFFRKAPGAACTDFDPASDTVLSRDFMGADGSTADVNRTDLVWDVLQAAPDSEIKVLFSTDDGRPLVMYGGAVQPPDPGPPQRYYVQLRSTKYDVGAGNPALNPTRRRLELSPTGTAMISVCPAGPNTLPCTQ